MIRAVRIPAKASGTADCSDGIVVSFESKWYPALSKSDFSLIIRKRVPVTQKPDWLYFHINSPRSAICARAQLISTSLITTELVHTHTSDLCLDHKEIDEYCGGLVEVGAYHIGKIQLAPVEVSASMLEDRVIYSPPQSFMFLSHRAKEIIDAACNFPQV